MSELINVPQYVEKKVMFVISCSSFINDLRRTEHTFKFCTKFDDIIIKKTSTPSYFYGVRKMVMFSLNKYFSKFHFERGERIIYYGLFYVPTPLARYKIHTPSLLEEDKNISRFVERKVERFPLNPEYLKAEKFHFVTDYYEIREPLITYLEKKYPKKKLLIKELKKLFLTTKANCKDYDSYLEKEAKFLLETTTKEYQNSLKR